MLPERSNAAPIGHDMLPSVYPCDGEIGVPSALNSDIALCGALFCRNWQGGSWKPKLLTQTLLPVSTKISQPEPLMPPPKNGEPGAHAPEGANFSTRVPAQAKWPGGSGTKLLSAHT